MISKKLCGFFSILFSNHIYPEFSVGFCSVVLVLYILEVQCLENSRMLWKECRHWGSKGKPSVTFPLECNPKDSVTRILHSCFT